MNPSSSRGCHARDRGATNARERPSRCSPASRPILDIGCGARITAVAVYQPYPGDLVRRAGGRITTIRASMDALPFPDSSFDLLWAEGSIFVMGFGEGLISWRRLLGPGGYLCLTDSPSPEAAAFWNGCYPAMTTVREICKIAERAGYDLVATFPLPASAWWDDYYAPLMERLEYLRPMAAGNPGAEALIRFMEIEIAVHREHGSEYGYEFFILRKRG